MSWIPKPGDVIELSRTADYGMAAGTRVKVLGVKESTSALYVEYVSGPVDPFVDTGDGDGWFLMRYEWQGATLVEEGEPDTDVEEVVNLIESIRNHPQWQRVTGVQYKEYLEKESQEKLNSTDTVRTDGDLFEMIRELINERL